MSKPSKRSPKGSTSASELPYQEFVQFLGQRNIYLGIFDAENQCTYSSPSLKTLLGKEPANLRDLVEQLTENEKERNHLIAFFDRKVEGEKTDDDRLELASQQGNGQAEAYAVTAFRSLSGVNPGLIVVIDDITHEQTLKREVDQMGRLATMGQITAGVAHELNNILTSVLGWTQIGHQNAGNPSTVTSSLEIIEGNARRARDIASRLLSISKESQEKHRPVRVAEILQEVLRLLTWEMKRSGIQVVHFLDSQDRVLGDENSISQVFINIIRNAMDAMPDGGTLQVSVLKRDNEVEIAFTDTGPGIDTEILEQIFDPFFSTKRMRDTSTHGGTGLGLSICRDIVEQHGGTIHATSQPGRGTRFTITFPVTSEETEDAPVSEPEPEAPETAQQNRTSIPPGAHVLVADDEPDVGEMVRIALELKGATVYVAQSGAEAVELCRKHNFQAAFVDYSMPGLSGHSLGREMLAIRPELPLIFMSGREVDVVQDIPVADFLKKPFDLDDIQIKLRTVLTGDLDS